MSSTDAPVEADGPEESETDEAREALLAQLIVEFGDALVGSHVSPGDDLTVRVTVDVWRDLADHLRTELGFGYFNFLAGLDWMPSPYGRDMDSQVDNQLEPPDAKETDPMQTGVAGGDTRFQVFGRVHDVVRHRGITVKTDVPDSLTVPSWVPVYRGADWHERECWEMFGIDFEGHDDLRHIYLPGAFEGNPLRKDYPLLARRMKPWPGIVDVELMPGEEAAK